MYKHYWYVNYGTGAGDFEYYGTLEEVLDKADDNAAYTQQDYEVVSGDRKDYSEVWVRQWVGYPYDETTGFEPEEVIQFGRFGFYAPWECY